MSSCKIDLYSLGSHLTKKFMDIRVVYVKSVFDNHFIYSFNQFQWPLHELKLFIEESPNINVI